MKASKSSNRATRQNLLLRLENLEDRSVPATLGASPFPSLDGSGHNLGQPSLGIIESDYLRKAPASYVDGVSIAQDANLPNPRTISNTLSAESSPTANNRSLTAFVYVWGQFIDHDIALTDLMVPKESLNIAIPTGDPSFDPAGTGTATMPFSRSEYDTKSGASPAAPRQQVNSTTAWLDASMVYGTDATTSTKLRELSGGRMKIGANGLLPNDPTTGQPMAGDPRAAEHPGLQTIHALFLREHNRIAGEIAKANPKFSDEEIFQRTRLRIIGEIQSITYNEYLPALLGSAAPKAYTGYKPGVSPNLTNEFATAAYRVGHTLVTDEIGFMDANGKENRDPLPLRDAFFNTAIVPETGVEPIFKYLASDLANEIDTKIVDDLRDFLFGAPGSGGMDLAALNIQRGRDHGLADYNTTRASFGLPRVTTFAQITPDVSMQENLKSLYGDVNHIDLWIGGLAEGHLAGSSVGPTFARIMGDQFERLRASDRFWYQNTFQGADRTSLENLHLSDLLKRDTNLTNIQDNVFIFKTTISGSVFADTNNNGIRNPGEAGLGGRLVELVDETGAVIASMLTRPDGTYRFENVPLGSFTVREVLPQGRISTSPVTTVTLTKGQSARDMEVVVNLGEGRVNPGAPPATPAPPAPPRR